MEEALEEQTNPTVPGKYIAIILKFSVFKFNNELYQQKVGTSMRTKPSPSYADIFISRKVDKRFFEIAEKYMVNGKIPLKFLKRFLDNIYFFLYISWIHCQIS